jgi:hypothetical protein
MGFYFKLGIYIYIRKLKYQKMTDKIYYNNFSEERQKNIEREINVI